MRKNMKYALMLLAASLLLLTGPLQAAGLGNNIVVKLVGDNVLARAPSADELAIIQSGPECAAFGACMPANTNCFDVGLVDAKTGRLIGTAADCLSDVTPDGDGLYLTGSTFFHFPGGVVASQGITTVHPISEGSPNFTHITGAIPDPMDDSVIYGDRKFRKASGPVRLSGAVNLSLLASEGRITFDCVFILGVGPN